MKKILLNFILVLFSVALWSQKKSQDDYAIVINGNKIATNSNFKEQFKQIKSSSNQKKQKNSYSLLQFSQIPSLGEQQKLERQGIKLLSFLSNNAYYVSIDSKFYSQKNVSENIRTIVDVQPKFKLDPTILNKNIPDYAKEGEGNFKVVVSYFKGIDQKELEQDLAKLNVKGIRNIASFNEVYLAGTREKLLEMAKLNWVQNIEPISAPVESDNLPSLNSHKSNVLNSNIPGLGYGLSGKGVKMGIWDGNLEKHKDHTGRVVAREYEDPASHGDHVLGTALGAGLLDPKAKGMAPETLAYGWNFNLQSNGLPVYEEREKSAIEDGIEITQNSYGVRLQTAYSIFRYNVSDRGDDNVMNRFPYLLNVYSNGNDQARNPQGFNTTTKNSKNALHVAANNPDDVISNYSSFGPTIDGRLLPQIAAVGTNVYSLDYNNSYQVLQGTSMATPGVSGTIALLYERYKNIYGIKPLASLMKAVVCNTARDVGNPGPDYKYGFGNLNAIRAVKAIDNKTFYTGAIGTGTTLEKDIIVPAGLVSLKVMLAYTDLPSTSGSSSVLVNDLDIKIVKDGVEILPWVLNSAIPNNNATRGVDSLNNIEQITIDNPSAGTYKIIVKGTRIPIGTQEFSVVYDYVAPELKLTYPIGNEKFNPGNTEYIRWDYEGEAKTFNIEYSIDGGLNYSTITQNIPANVRTYTWIVPSGVVSNAKIRVSAGSKVDFSKENFVVMPEPKNLVITPAACGVSSYKMDWDPIVGAKYEVLKLNGFQFDPVAVVTEPTYTFNLSAGENNWFSVRAIDIATNATSERVRAINVEPIDKPILTATSLPFKENFNERKATKYSISKASAAGSIGYEYYNKDFVDGIKVSGNGTASPTPWVASTSTNAFANNPSFIKRITFCDIDASSLTGKALRLKFNLKWNAVATNKSFFRVTVNGTPLVNSIDNASVYGGENLTGETVLNYDLSAFAGTSFNLNIESVIDNDVINPTTTPVFNTLFVDNIEIFEPTLVDLEMSNLTTTTGLTATETVSVEIKNLSSSPLSNIPVSYKINNQDTVTEIIQGPLNPLNKINYNFTQKADLSALGAYSVNATVNYTEDAILNNNSITRTVSNIGTDVLIGSSPSVTTCNAVFTDSGNRFNNYANSLNQTITFVPAVTGNSIKVDFTNFAIEKDFDFLFVYNGSNTSSPLLGTFTGNVLPPSITSSATGGQLTFRFTSDNADVDLGWIVNISCVPAPTTSDAGILSIITPEILGKKTSANDIKIRVVNIGPTALTNVPVFYQVDGGTKVTDVVPNIDANTTFEFTFATKADLSIIDAKYTITSGIDQVDVNAANNSLSKVVYNRNKLPNHTNTNGFAISKLKWNDIEKTSTTTAYSDFKSTKIPVYAGFTYQPEVTIVKAETPITRDLTGVSGVFTMMVIDLNGDGNLTDEFYGRNYWVNTLNNATAPALPSLPATHYFRNEFSLAGGVTIPANTAPGEKLMRIIHMFRSPNEFYNINLGPSLDGLTTSRQDFEIEEYTVNVLPFLPADASIESIVNPTKSSNKPANVSAVVRNYSNGPISNFPVAYKINGGTEVIENVTATIASGATTTFTFATKADLSLPTDYTIEVYTKLDGDVNTSNDIKTLTFSRKPDYATNVVGSFDGVNDYIVSDLTTPINLTNNYTFEAWINQKASGVFGRILDKARILFFVHNNNNLALYKENSLVLSITTAAGNYVINTDANSIKQNRYHHVAYTVSSANVYTIYIDGQVANYTIASVANIAAGPATVNNTNPIFIGNNATLGRAFNGEIDEVRVWNKVLDQSAIATNLLTKYTGNEPGLIAYYPFSEGDKQYLYDKSVSDNVATVLNSNTDGLGVGKFWNVPLLLQNIQFDNQIANSYDTSTRTYTVLLSDGSNISNLVANFNPEMKSLVKVNGVLQTSGVTTNDFTNPVVYSIEGVGFNTGIVQDYTVKVISGLNNESKLISFNFDTNDNAGLGQPINTTILGANAKAIVPFGTNVTNLKANFKVSPGAELFIDQVKQIDGKTTALDYSTNRIVTVVSENKIVKTNYTISVDARNTSADFLSYNVSNQVGQSIIDTNTKTINVFVNNNATLASLYPTFEVSPKATARIGTYIQNSGESILKYTAPVLYNVLAQNHDIVNWTITIQRAKPTLALLGDQTITLNKGCKFIEPGYTASDNLNNDITASVLVSGTINTDLPGQYTLTYTVKDALGNQISTTRTVNVTSETCTLGINENTIEGFSVFPTISNGKVYVLTASKAPKNIKVYDFIGKQVFSLQTSDKEVNLINLPSGVYVMRIEQDNKTGIKKLIIE
jgi:hypothetical protein